LTYVAEDEEDTTAIYSILKARIRQGNVLFLLLKQFEEFFRFSYSSSGCDIHIRLP
jgi:hypothetical protein